MYGSGMRSSNASQNSLGIPDGRPFLSLYERMGKLNLQRLDDENASERRSQAGEQANYNVGNASAFGNNERARSSSVGAAANALAEEINKVSIESEITSQDTRNGSMETPEFSFVFGSNMMKRNNTRHISAMSEKSFSPDILNGIQKLNIGNFKDDDNSTRRKYADGQFHKYAFTLGDDNKVSDSSEGGATLHEDIQKLNIRDEIENSDFNAEKGRDTLPNAPSSKYAYDGSKHEKDSIINDIPSSSVHGSFWPEEGAEPSFDGPSFGQDSRFAETGFSFTSMREEVGLEQMKFRSPKSINELPKESLFAGARQHMPISGRKGETKGSRMKRRNSKLRHPNPFQQTFTQAFVSVEKMLESKVPDSPDGYSPMDYSPYQENIVAERSATTSVPYTEPDKFASPSESINLQNLTLEDENEHLISATQRLYITEDDTQGELDHNDSSDHEFGPRFSADAQVCIPDISSSAAMETESKLFDSSVFGTNATKAGTSFNIDSSSQGSGASMFNFGGSSFGQSPLPASKCQHPVKVASSTVESDPAIGIKTMKSGPHHAGNTRVEADTKLEANRNAIINDSERAAEHDACEKWRLRGNQAYANGLLLKAQEYYTCGVNSLSHKDNSQSCKRALMLCYSNRAAARMSLGRMREALSDCMLAIAIDSQFLRAHVRAANCHLALGEADDALKHFNKCLLLQHDGSSDQKILVEVSDGLQKAQKVADYMVQAKDLLQKRTSNEVTQALQMISDALSISMYSETLMEMKAEALLKLLRYEEAIKFCEQSKEQGERNAGTNVHLSNMDKSGNTLNNCVRHWRLNIISKANFYLGRFEEALELLRTHDQVETTVDENNNECSGSLSLFNTIRELLHLKASGNEAFKEGRHRDAIKHYSAALSFNTDSRPFSAVCFCNRAAAYQAMGQITDAIADCCLAIALDASYAKALSRRAALYERIRDYGQAANDLHRLISLLEKQNEDKVNQDGTFAKSTNNNSDLCQARMRLSIVEEEARKDSPLDVYLILGIEPSSTAADVKKAYRKAALRHHPDKAGQLFARSEHLEDGLWREVAEEVQRDADRLFKMIGEAYTVLSDPLRYKFC